MIKVYHILVNRAIEFMVKRSEGDTREEKLEKVISNLTLPICLLIFISVSSTISSISLKDKNKVLQIAVDEVKGMLDATNEQSPIFTAVTLSNELTNKIVLLNNENNILVKEMDNIRDHNLRLRSELLEEKRTNQELGSKLNQCLSGEDVTIIKLDSNNEIYDQLNLHGAEHQHVD